MGFEFSIQIILDPRLIAAEYIFLKSLQDPFYETNQICTLFLINLLDMRIMMRHIQKNLIKSN